MVEENIRLVRDSRSRLREKGAEIASPFYERLFAMAPEVRPLFKGGISGQAVKFDLMIDTIVDGLPEWAGSLRKIEALGRAHRDFGALAHHYELVTQALLATLKEALGEEFTTEVESAWRDLLTMISRVMIDACDYGNWMPEGDDRGNPMAPIVGVSVQRYAFLVHALGDLDSRELTDARLSSLGIDRQIWEAVRSGWNARLTHPRYGSVVAVEYMAAYRRCGETA